MFLVRLIRLAWRMDRDPRRRGLARACGLGGCCRLGRASRPDPRRCELSTL